MDDDFEKLKLLKAEQISEKTHITKSNIIYILSKSFNKFDKIQFNGFIYILERDYSLNLQNLKNEYQEYLKSNGDILEPQLQASSNGIDQNKKLLWLFLVVVIAIIAVWSIYKYMSKHNNTIQHKLSLNSTVVLNNTTVANLNSNNITKKNVTIDTIVANDMNITDKVSEKAIAIKNAYAVKNKAIANFETTLTKPNVEKTFTPINDTNKTVVAKHIKTIKLLTNSKLWLGITNMNTWKQRQKIVSSSLDLNGTGDYLLILGHGMVSIQTDDRNISFPQTKTVFLMLKSGKITKLTRKQFARLNKGKLW